MLKWWLFYFQQQVSLMKTKGMMLADMLKAFAKDLEDKSTLTDIAPLLEHFHKNLIEHLDAVNKKELLDKYNKVFNEWYRARTWLSSDIAVQSWLNVVNESEALLLELQTSYKIISPIDEFFEIDFLSKMYTDALLFLVYSRVSVEPESLYLDITSKGYCKWLWDTAKHYFSAIHVDFLMERIALYNPDEYESFCILTDEKKSRDELLKNYLGSVGHTGFIALDIIPKEIIKPLRVLRDILYRLIRLQDFIKSMENGVNVLDYKWKDDNVVVLNLINSIENSNNLST